MFEAAQKEAGRRGITPLQFAAIATLVGAWALCLMCKLVSRLFSSPSKDQSHDDDAEQDADSEFEHEDDFTHEDDCRIDERHQARGRGRGEAHGEAVMRGRSSRHGDHGYEYSRALSSLPGVLEDEIGPDDSVSMAWMRGRRGMAPSIAEVEPDDSVSMAWMRGRRGMPPPAADRAARHQRGATRVQPTHGPARVLPAREPHELPELHQRAPRPGNDRESEVEVDDEVWPEDSVSMAWMRGYETARGLCLQQRHSQAFQPGAVKCASGGSGSRACPSGSRARPPDPPLDPYQAPRATRAPRVLALPDADDFTILALAQQPARRGHPSKAKGSR
jgi:hypothetical protein